MFLPRVNFDHKHVLLLLLLLLSLSLSSGGGRGVGKNYRESKRLKSYIILLRKQTLKEQYTTEKASA